MALYDQIKEYIVARVFENTAHSITGTKAQEALLQIVNTVGGNSAFMGSLDNDNKPTAVGDVKQFYFAYNNTSSTIAYDLSDCGYGTLTVAPGDLYVLYNNGGTWQADNLTGRLQIILATKANTADISAVGLSGSYNDLTNKPTIPAEQVQSNWTETDTASKAYIQNKPTLAAVATSGSYNDLSNTPEIPNHFGGVTSFMPLDGSNIADVMTDSTLPEGLLIGNVLYVYPLVGDSGDILTIPDGSLIALNLNPIP